MRDFVREILTLMNFINVVAFALAIWQTLAARRQMKEAETQTRAVTDIRTSLQTQLDQSGRQAKELNEIRQSLSTQHLGPFPSYLPRITEVIESAESEIMIVCDYPAYGCFSAHAIWHDYSHALDQKSLDEKINISLLCPDEPTRTKTSEEQFGKQREDWDQWKNQGEVKKKLQSLMGKKVDVQSLTFERFIEALKEEDRDMLGHLKNKVDIEEMPTFSALHCWVADRRRAVFAIPSYSDNVSNGFWTTDSKLIAAFYDIRDRFVREAKEKRAREAGREAVAPRRGGGGDGGGPRGDEVKL